MDAPRVLPLVVVLIAVAAPQPRLLAQCSRFAAEYSVSSVHLIDDDVSLALNVLVANVSEVVVVDARIRLLGSDGRHGSETQGSGPVLAMLRVNKLRPWETARLEQRIRIPLSEYTYWREGLPPRFSIEYAESSAGSRPAPIPSARSAAASGSAKRVELALVNGLR